MIFILKVIIALSLMMLANYIGFAWIEIEDYNIKDRLKDIKKGEYAPIVAAIAKLCYCNLVMLYTIALFYGYSISTAFSAIFYVALAAVLLIEFARYGV